jgi:hypothetical protein
VKKMAARTEPSRQRLLDHAWLPIAAFPGTHAPPQDEVGRGCLGLLAIVNCMSGPSGVPVVRSETPVALTKVPFGLQMPTGTPGVWLVYWN